MGHRRLFSALMAGLVFIAFAPVAAAQLIVDCTGGTSGAYTSINAALSAGGNGAYIVVLPDTTCNEDVNIIGMSNVNLGTWWAQRVAIHGSINIYGSTAIFIYGFDVTSPNADGSHPNGIQVSSSLGINLNACTSTHNQGNGLRVDAGSSVTVGDSGNFSDNGDSGTSITRNSELGVAAWGMQLDIMRNNSSGVYVDRSKFESLGHVRINDNLAAGATQPNGFGIDMRGASSGYQFTLFGPTEISGNQGGGISLLENSEFSVAGHLPGAPDALMIGGNGPTGISAGHASQLTVFGGVEIKNHKVTALDIFANSQANVVNDNQITGTGGSGDPGAAAIRIDGNSELYMRSGSIANNTAPGIMALVNSSVDALGVTFNGNTGSNFVCDSSAVISSDMKGASLGAANSCRVVGPTGLNHGKPVAPSAPKWNQNKAASDRFKAAVSKFHR